MSKKKTHSLARRPHGLCAGLCIVAAALMISGVPQSAHAAPCSAPYTKGDVFASVGSGTVNVYSPTGTLNCTLNDTTGATYTTGSGFDSSGNFYVTNFGSSGVSKFDNSGTLVAPTFMAPGAQGTPESIDVQSTGFYSGTSLVGGPGIASIDQYNTATGALIHSFSVTGGNLTGGTDWVDTYNPTTGRVIYDGEGTQILSATLNADGTTTQGPVFANQTTTNGAFQTIYAMRTIPSGAFAGNVLVANSTNALMLDSSGNVVKTYTLPGNGGVAFSLNLDPNGTDFWTGDSISGRIWQVNIATGAINQNWLTGAASNTLYGLSVYGEIHQGGNNNTVPEPATMLLFSTGLIGLGALRLRRRKSIKG